MDNSCAGDEVPEAAEVNEERLREASSSLSDTLAKRIGDPARPTREALEHYRSF